MLGPPCTEQLKVTLSLGSVTTVPGRTDTPPSGDTVKHHIKKQRIKKIVNFKQKCLHVGICSTQK